MATDETFGTGAPDLLEATFPVPPVPTEPAPLGLATRPPRRRGVSWLVTLLLIPLMFYAGVLFEYHLGPDVNISISALLFAQPGRGGGLDHATLDEIWQIMQRRYPKKDLNAQDAFNGAAQGLVHLYLNEKYQDGFSYYLTPEELAREKQDLSGQFGGIGANVSSKDGKLVVTGTVSGSPAEQSGMKKDDVIVKVDGVAVTGQAADAVVTRIHGAVGTHVIVTVLRGTKTIDIDMVRATIVVPSVRYKRDIAPKVLYVRIYRFGERTDQELRDALKDGFSHGDTQVVLDLRGNPGGYVDKADSTVSEFVQSGLSVVVRGRDDSKEEHRVSGQGSAFKQKLVVLIDGQTASAAEIVAGALKDNKRGTLVGDKTFGKGLVENDYPLRNGGDLHLTIAYWFTPAGTSIDHNGITPDRPVALSAPDSFFQVDQDGSDIKKDNQLQAALAVLKGK